MVATTSIAQNGTPAGAIHTADSEVTDGLRKEGVKYETKRAIVWVESGSLSEAEIKEFAGLVDRGVLDVESYTGIEFDRKHFRAKKIEYFIGSRTGISHASDDGKPFVYLTPKRVRERSALYLHETTHVIVWRDMPLWLLEGFPCHVETYLDKRYGGHVSNVFNPENRPVDELARDVLRQPIGERVLPLVGVSGKFDALGDEEAKNYSFIFEDRKVRRQKGRRAGVLQPVRIVRHVSRRARRHEEDEKNRRERRGRYASRHRERDGQERERVEGGVAQIARDVALPAPRRTSPRPSERYCRIVPVDGGERRVPLAAQSVPLR